MLLSIRHRTQLSYTERISESVMELRMAPRSDSNQTLRGFGLAVGPSVPLFEHVDWLGNHVHQFSVIDFHERLVIVAHSAVDTHPRHRPLGEADDPHPFEINDHRLLDFLRFAGPVVHDERLEHLAGYLGLGSTTRAAEVVERVTMALGTRVQYKKGVTTSSATVRDVLEQGAGVCQDFAHLGIALLRLSGIPARYVSGYLHRPGEPELETHAWVEAYLPSQGWVAVDPTHSQVADQRHIAVAVGQSYQDVPPNRGVFRGNAIEAIDVSVQIDEVDEVPRGLLAPRPAALDIPVFPEGEREHREQIDYQQEQQQQQ